MSDQAEIRALKALQDYRNAIENDDADTRATALTAFEAVIDFVTEPMWNRSDRATSGFHGIRPHTAAADFIPPGAIVSTAGAPAGPSTV